VLDCARNPPRAGEGMDVQLQSLAMRQPFQARRTTQSAASSVKAESVQPLQPSPLHALCILCSLWGKVQICFCTHEGTPFVTSNELQAEEDYRPDVLCVPLHGLGQEHLTAEQILLHANGCRTALNEFFAKVS
jgi:hypothetical protein